MMPATVKKSAKSTFPAQPGNWMVPIYMFPDTKLPTVKKQPNHGFSRWLTIVNKWIRRIKKQKGHGKFRRDGLFNPSLTV
jgi:hypothetical protein